jgi:spore coat polysaccharide biosynthesis predicted glycosyltransferase SpsG
MMISSAKSLTDAQGILEPSGKAFLWVCTGADPQMGFGHLRRTVVLAQSLLDCCDPIFLIDSQDQWSCERLDSLGFSYDILNPEQVWSVLLKPAAILIDTRNPASLDRLIADANDRKIPVASIHDLGLNPLPSDVLIDGSISPRFEKSNRNAIHYGGTPYMVLDPEFRALHKQKKQIRENIETIFINLGGGDSKRYFLKVLEGLRLWGRSVKIAGAPGFASWGQEDIARMEWQPLDFSWEKGSISSVLFQADMAITAGGLAAYEALCAGTPLMALSYDGFQQSAIRALTKSGACTDLGPGDNFDPARLPEKLTAMECNLIERNQHSCRGRQIIDGLGAQRVSQVIRDLIHPCSSRF